MVYQRLSYEIIQKRKFGQIKAVSVSNSNQFGVVFLAKCRFSIIFGAQHQQRINVLSREENDCFLDLLTFTRLKDLIGGKSAPHKIRFWRLMCGKPLNTHCGDRGPIFHLHPWKEGADMKVSIKTAVCVRYGQWWPSLNKNAVQKWS